ncbi:putative metalloprotease CJM1_0395 family protein [Poseidonibacter sp.]|uniref:putative metalloprotease CJM1_0395 family protein n=3 Tax=Poseidonibacter sp. TaxID=2321188 RepID=UPI003C731B6A
MEINSNYQSISSIHQEIALKKSQLATIDKKEIEKSVFEKNDTVNISDNKYDENDYERVLEKFKNLDAQTRTHEQTHASLANTLGAINYNYQTGPDGKLYATGGHVRLDTSIPQDEEAAIAKLDDLAKAATASEGLSGADAMIARTANLNKMLLMSKQEGENYDNK